MPAIAASDLARMRDQLLFEGPDTRRKLSRFWILLVLAAVIASAGVAADSTATVIGAMIVAPLMTPILGTVLAIVVADGRQLLQSVLLVVSGSLVVVAIGFLIGVAVPADVVATTSTQVSGRISPRLIDLVAALATGAVGAFALVRSDVSDTLPGVAIAISLVPPLAVVGITLEAGAEEEAVGALLLFLANVSAILLSGLIVMALFHVRRTASAAAGSAMTGGRLSLLVVVAFVVVVVVPLGGTSARIASDSYNAARVTAVAEDWAGAADWRIASVAPESGVIVVHAAGGLPAPSAAELRRALDADGLGGVDVRLVLTPEETIDLDASP